MNRKIYSVLAAVLLVVLFAACSVQPKNNAASSEPALEQLALNDSTVIVDVRTPEEFAAGHIATSINIPLDVIASETDQLKVYKTVITVCRSGNRSGKAKALLEEAGFTNVFNGGAWQTFDAKMKSMAKPSL